MPLKVIGAGFGRTGTMSLKVALEQLGFGPCHHMVEVIAHLETTRYWIDAALKRPVDWDEVFRGYASAVDFPTCMFYRELSVKYPNTKVILTTRDPESWFASTQATIFNPQTMQRAGRMPQFDEMLKTMLVTSPLKGRVHDHDFAIAAFKAHNEEARRTIPRERLLDYDVAQGWGPLCAFLGVKVPSGPFPKANTREEFGRMSDEMTQEHQETAGQHQR